MGAVRAGKVSERPKNRRWVCLAWFAFNAGVLAEPRLGRPDTHGHPQPADMRAADGHIDRARRNSYSESPGPCAISRSVISPGSRRRAPTRRYGRLPIRLPWQSAPYRKIVLRFIGFSLAAHPGSPLAPEGGSRAAAISTAQDHHLARPAPLNRRCHASGSQPCPGSCRAFSERSSNRWQTFSRSSHAGGLPGDE